MGGIRLYRKSFYSSLFPAYTHAKNINSAFTHTAHLPYSNDNRRVFTAVNQAKLAPNVHAL